MDNMKKYIELYKQKREDCFKKWGYYYPPIDWNEFEAWNNKTCQKHLNETEWKSEVIKTKVYVDLLDNDKEFGFFMAFQNNDFELLNNVLYQTSRQKLLDRSMTASGTDHANVLMNALSAFSCNDFDIIKYFFPKELPLSKGKFYTEVSVNLLKVLYYKDNSLLEESLQKAQKFLSKKITQWEKLIVLYFLSLINRDIEQVNNCLHELCSAYQKMEHSVDTFYNKLAKCFAKEIHGLYRFAKLIDKDLFLQIQLPKHDCFFEEFETWQKENDYPKGKIFYKYPTEMDYMNKILEAELPTIMLRAAKNGTRTEFYKDEEKFAFDLTENVKKLIE
jgi:hypothetical protein